MRPWLAGALLALAWPAAAAPTVELLVQTSPLAGFQYHAGRALWPLMRVGDHLALVREPWNPHDAEAIRVEWRGAMIGFVPKRENKDLARLMDGGTKLAGRIVHLQRSRDPWRRVLFDVGLAQASREDKALSAPDKDSGL